MNQEISYWTHGEALDKDIFFIKIIRTNCQMYKRNSICTKGRIFREGILK